MGFFTAPVAVEPLRCPSCRARQDVPTGAAAHRCRACGVGWRWGVCRACDRLVCTLFAHESWQCPHCATYTRAWWNTAQAERDRAAVEARRSREATTTLRRWVGPATGMVAALLVTAGVITGAGAGGGRAGASADACRLFAEIRRHEAGGTLTAGQLERELAALVALAEDASPLVARAAGQLGEAAGGGADGDAFQAAATRMEQACR